MIGNADYRIVQSDIRLFYETVIMQDGKKQCTRCGETNLAATNFYPDRRRGGYYSWCKACEAKKHAERFAKNPEAVRARARVAQERYRQRHPKRIDAYLERRRAERNARRKPKNPPKITNPRARRTALAVERARNLLSYDPNTGILTWMLRPGDNQSIRTWNTRFAGKEAGMLREDGYRVIGIDGKNYYAHRVIWLIVQGEWIDEIDHRDLNPSNNRWNNLRKATQSQNMANQALPPHNTSGFKGVFWHKQRGYWVARIKVMGAYQHLGCFSTKEGAGAAYEKAAVAVFGEFARVR
jgi:hypothetical protein